MCVGCGTTSGDGPKYTHADDSAIQQTLGSSFTENGFESHLKRLPAPEAAHPESGAIERVAS